MSIRTEWRHLSNYMNRIEIVSSRWSFLVLAFLVISVALTERSWGDQPASDHEAWSDTVDPDYQHASPEAYEAWKDRRFGMRIHWGMYSHLGLDASWPVGTDQGASKEFQEIYYTLYQVWNPVNFDADAWAELAEQAGMKYFVVTTKHCEGFCMWDTDTKVKALKRFPEGRVPGIGRVKEVTIDYDVMDTRFKRDVVKELCDAFRARGMGVGLYYSNWDWNDPHFRWDKNNRSYDPAYGPDSHPEEWQAFIDRQREQVRELCTNYGQIDQIGLDCGWPKAAWPGMVEIIKMARRLQPNVLFRHRGVGPYGDYMTPEHWVPQDGGDPRVQKPWQAISTFGSRWAWQPNDTYRSKEWVLSTVIDCSAKGGNYMLGVSPLPDGTFDETTRDTLLWVGRWLKVNGEAIYGTRPWRWHQERDGVRFTRSKDDQYVYVIMEGTWPGEQFISEKIQVRDGSQIHLLGFDQPLAYEQDARGLRVTLPAALQDPQARPCEYAWVLRCEPAERP